jgi:hypothetical protein
LKRIAGLNKKKNEKLILVPLFFLVFLLQQEHNCKDFKTGKFKFEYEVDGVKKQRCLNEMTVLKLKILKVK